MPGLHPVPTARSRATGAARTRPSIVKPIALDRANLLRIRDGRGTRIRVASGVLWVTEENSPDDHVLLPGAAIDLAKKGTAIVLAHRPARLVIEVPPGVTPPRRVEMALADGERGWRIALAVATPISLATIAAGVATVIGNALASIRTMVIDK
jgi:hypothetical protein